MKPDFMRVSQFAYEEIMRLQSWQWALCVDLTRYYRAMALRGYSIS